MSRELKVRAPFMSIKLCMEDKNYLVHTIKQNVAKKYLRSLSCDTRYFVDQICKIRADRWMSGTHCLALYSAAIKTSL